MLNQSQAQYNIQPERAQVAQASAAFQFSVLTCRHQLLATKTILADGKEIPFGHAKHFRFAYRELDLLEDFCKALQWLATEPNKFIIRGRLKPGLTGWHRRLFRGSDATIDCEDRSWIALDLDGVEVPPGLGSPAALAEAGYHIRDRMLPGYFRGIRCIAAATSSTGRMGPAIARLRLFFLLSQPAPNESLYAWAEVLSRSQSKLRLDPSVMLAQQPIYTARPIFRGLSDPVPSWSRVRLLDGYEDYAMIEVPREPRKRSSATWTQARVCTDVPPELLEMTMEDAGCGVHWAEATEPTDRAWKAIRRAFELLDGCPKPGGDGRHKTLTKVAYELCCLVAEGEVPRALARDAYFEAAEGINNYDGKYDAAAIERRLDDAFADIGRK
jgi:hypothetical protein